MSLRQATGPGSGVPCLHALSGPAHEPAPDDRRHQAADDQGEEFMKRQMSWALLVAEAWE